MAKEKPVAAPVGISMWSPDGKDCHIGLTSGHTLVISGERTGTLVEKRFRREAIAHGCVPVGMELDDDQPKGPTRREEITKALNKMLESDDKDAFTPAGKPNLNQLVKLTGFGVDRSEANDIMDEINGVGKYNKNKGGPDGGGDDDSPDTVSVG